MPLTKAAAATRRSWLHYFCANILTISPLEEKTSRRVAWRLTKNNSAHDSGVVRKGNYEGTGGAIFVQQQPSV